MTADPKSKVYGSADPALTFQLTSGSLLSGDSLTGALTRAAGESVSGGPYPITQGTLTAGGNYALTFVGAALTITPKPVTVTADDQSKVYGNSDPSFTFQVGGLELRRPPERRHLRRRRHSRERRLVRHHLRGQHQHGLRRLVRRRHVDDQGASGDRHCGSPDEGLR